MSITGRIAKKLHLMVCLGLLVTMMPLALSCYGRFPLTHAIYRMNGNAGGKVVQTVVFWFLVIVPVYSVAMFADAIIMNLVEFWTGDGVEVSSVQERDGVRVALEPATDGREAVLTVSRDGQPLTVQHMVKVSATAFEMRSATGELTGTVLKTADGGIQLGDADGRIIRTLTAADLASFPRR